MDEAPYFGYMRGCHTKAKMKEIDSFAASLGITVMPCIQTMAHLNGTFQWKKVPLDCADILLTDTVSLSSWQLEIRLSINNPPNIITKKMPPKP